MSFLSRVVKMAKADRQTIVLPETDPRVLDAAEKVLENGVAKLLIVSEDEGLLHSRPGLSEAKIIAPSKYERLDEMAEMLAEIRKSKGMTKEEAKKILLESVLFFGVMLVKTGVVDGMVAGACHSTADVLRPALQILKTAPGIKLVSGAMIMETPIDEFGEHGLLVFGDCAINPYPNSEELAHIAISSADTFRDFVGVEPKVAMLSFSTKGSAKHENVDKVIEATRLAKELKPDLEIDGELQLDAALIPSVAELKAKGSHVAGKANVLIFPSLDVGNVGYKLVQRFGRAEVYGPICQGISMPLNDLSRGATVGDIYGTIAITALQAIRHKEKK